MTRPFSYLLRMIVLVVAVNAGVLYLEPGVRSAFLANPFLNGAILLTLLVGAYLAFRQMVLLDGDVSWVQAYRRDRGSVDPEERGNFLGELAHLLVSGGVAPGISAAQRQGILDSIHGRLDDGRETQRFLVNVLILLGLMGTFWGLLQTISGISGVIGTLTVGEGDLSRVFERLKEGLRAPLAGMSISFSCSLFGVASSVVLGLLDLQVGLAQRRFMDELEAWLSRISGAEVPVAAAPAVTVTESNPIFMQALIQQLADGTEQLQRSLLARDAHESGERSAMRSVAEKLSEIADHFKRQQASLSKLSDYEGQLSSSLAALRDLMEANSGNEVLQSHLRSIDIAVRELADDLGSSRSQFISDFRQELKLLGRMLSAKTQNQA